MSSLTHPIQSRLTHAPNTDPCTVGGTLALQTVDHLDVADLDRCRAQWGAQHPAAQRGVHPAGQAGRLRCVALVPGLVAVKHTVRAKGVGGFNCDAGRSRYSISVTEA